MTKYALKLFTWLEKIARELSTMVGENLEIYSFQMAENAHKSKHPSKWL